MKFKPELATQKFAVLVTTPEEAKQLVTWANTLSDRRPRTQIPPLPAQLVVYTPAYRNTWEFMPYPSNYYNERGYTLISFNESTIFNIRRH